MGSGAMVAGLVLRCLVAQDGAALPAPLPPPVEQPAPDGQPPPSSTPKRVLVMPLEAKGGCSTSTAETLTAVVTESIMHQPGMNVISTAELTTLMEQERLRDVAGLSEASLVSNIAGRLNADETVFGTVGKLGDSLVVQLTRVRQADAQVVDRGRVQVASSQEALLVEVTAALTGQLYGGPPPVVPPPPPPAPPPTITLPSPRSLPVLDEPPNPLPWRAAAAVAGIGGLGTLLAVALAAGVGGGSAAALAADMWWVSKGPRHLLPQGGFVAAWVGVVGGAALGMVAVLLAVTAVSLVALYAGIRLWGR